MEQDLDDTVVRPVSRPGPGPSALSHDSAASRDSVHFDDAMHFDDSVLFGDTVLADDTMLVPRRPLDASSPGSAAAHTTAGAPALVEAPPPSPAPPAQAWYRFQVNAHEPIALDRPAYIGRRPGLPRVPPAVRPRLVRVPSPLQEVSSTHVEIRQKGTSVIVTDLKSTNGTTVIVPGALPRALRPGESLVITPGTIVNIGDGNRIELLPLQRSLRLSSTTPTTGTPTP